MISICFGELCICRTHTWNTWKKSQVRNQENVNADSTQINRRKAHLPCKLGPNTHMAMLQDHQANHQAKAVPKRPGQGAAAPPLAPLGPILHEVVSLMLWRSVAVGVA